MPESKLYNILSSLSQHSVDSVQSGCGFNDIDKYLHTERPITDELLNKMIEIDDAGGGIILLIGSAGDGKSHLLSKVRDGCGWPSDSFYNDATASCSPNKTAIETLKEGLIDFSDDNIQTTTKKKVLAINLGKLNAFIEDNEAKTTYGQIVRATSPLFDDDDSTPPLESERIKVVQFTNKQIFELYPEKEGLNALSSSFLTAILDKLVEPSTSKVKNPFHEAFLSDQENGFSPTYPVILNYRLLKIPEIRKAIVWTVIEAILRFKLVITPREYLDFIYSILVYRDLAQYKEKDNFYDALLPNLFYMGGNNTILKAISQLDPMKQSSTKHDNDLSLLFTSNAIPSNFLPALSSEEDLPEAMTKRINKFYLNNGRDVERTTKFLFRLSHLLNYHSESDVYLSFVEILKGVFRQDDDILIEIYELVNTAIPRHYGSYYQKPNHVPINIQGGEYKLFASLEMTPANPTCAFSKDKRWEFHPRFKLIWEVNKEIVSLPMDYSLYSYLYELREGKLAVTHENEKNIVFSHFLRELVSLSDCSKSLTIIKSGKPEMTLRESFKSIQLQ